MAIDLFSEYRYQRLYVNEVVYCFEKASDRALAQTDIRHTKTTALFWFRTADLRFPEGCVSPSAIHIKEMFALASTIPPKACQGSLFYVRPNKAEDSDNNGQKG